MSFQSRPHQFIRFASNRQIAAFTAVALLDGPLTVARSMLAKGYSIPCIKLVLLRVRRVWGF